MSDYTHEVKICNVLYPRPGCRDDEVERLDGVLLEEGIVIIDRCAYKLKKCGATEYTTSRIYGQQCSTVTYRWLKT